MVHRAHKVSVVQKAKKAKKVRLDHLVDPPDRKVYRVPPAYKVYRAYKEPLDHKAQ